jgi:hypothetical protein
MSSKSIFSSAVLAAGVIAAGVALPAAAADQMSADAHTGTAKVKLQYVHGVHQDGSPDPKHDAACKKQLSDMKSKFVGMPVATEYSIDTRTLTMSAKSMYPSPVATQPLEFITTLSPLGIKTVYAFGAFRPGELKNAYVLFSISEKFTNPVSTFLIINVDKDYNCVISSSKAPFKTAESAMLGMDQK